MPSAAINILQMGHQSVYSAFFFFTRNIHSDLFVIKVFQQWSPQFPAGNTNKNKFKSNGFSSYNYVIKYV